MGNLASASGHNYFESAWKLIERSADNWRPPGHKIPQIVAESRPVRVYLASTYRDFENERHFLHTEIFPEIERWCQLQRIHFIPMDIWREIPTENDKAHIIQAAFAALDKCFEDSIDGQPIFIGLIGERFGWVPKQDEIPANFLRKYRWIHGLSLTQMEIVYGVLRCQNGNAILLSRNSDFIRQVPNEYQSVFIQKDQRRHQNFKEACIERLQDLLGPDKVMEYTCKFISVDKKTDEVILDGFNEFRNIITAFLQEKISAMYPEESLENMQMTPVDLYKFYDLKHVAFFRQNAAKALAIQQDFSLVDKYLHDDASKGPFILMDSEGTGRTLTMASIAQHVLAEIEAGTLSNFSIFAHFVDADVYGKSLDFLLKRLLVALQSQVGTEPSDSGDLQRQCRLHLRDPNANDIVIIIDDLSQIDTLNDPMLSWLPSVFPPQVKCIISTDTSAMVAGTLLKRYSSAVLAGTAALDAETQQHLIKEILLERGHKIQDDEILNLSNRPQTRKPAWVNWACQCISLRQLGTRDFPAIPDSIEGAISIYMDSAVTSFELSRDYRNYVKAAFYLLTVSKSGLMERELQQLLQHKETLKLVAHGSAKAESEQQLSRHLPTFQWMLVYEKLRPFLAQNTGHLLRFRQESWRGHVGTKLFQFENNDEHPMKISNQWRQLLVHYFEDAKDIKFRRKCQILLENYESLGNREKMAQLLQKWQTFVVLFDPYFSDKLINFWSNISDIRQMCLHYSNLYDKRETRYNGSDYEAKLQEDCFKIASLWKQCGFYDAATKYYEDLCFRQPGSKLHHYMRLVDLYQIQYEIAVKQSKRGEDAELAKALLVLKKQKLLLDLLDVQGYSNVSPHIANSLREMAECHILRFSYFGMKLDEKKARTLLEKAEETLQGTTEINPMWPALMLNAKGVLSAARPNGSDSTALDLFLDAERSLSSISGQTQALIIVYENVINESLRQKKFNLAHEYLVKCRTLCAEYYGPTHPFTVRCAERFGEDWAKQFVIEQYGVNVNFRNLFVQ